MLRGCQLTAEVECSHQQPRLAVGQRAGQVGGHGELRGAVLVGGVQVVVVGDEVPDVDPAAVVERFAEAHEVGGQGLVGVRPHRRRLDPVDVADLVGAEPPPVQLLTGVGEVAVGDLSRRPDLLPAGVALAPEGRRPRVVELLDRAVTLLQPAPESHRAGVAEAVVVVAAVLIVHVPHHHRRVVVVALDQLGDEGRGGVTVGGRRGTVRLARAERARVADLVDERRLRVTLEEPRRRARGRGRQVHGDPARVQLVEHPVEPVEVVRPGLGLEQGPGEDPHADQVDPGLPHEAYVLVPDLLRPLLRVVVGAVGDPSAERLGDLLHSSRRARHGASRSVRHLSPSRR